MVEIYLTFFRFLKPGSLPEKYGIRIGEITEESYGKEVNIMDRAGVCRHFVE